jgi:acyl carrier protein
MDIERITERFLIDEILFGSRTNIDPYESLVTSGIVDSLALLRLVTYLEERFGVTFEYDEVIPDNFETIHGIKTLVESKLQ